jgi:hypothetical protein
VIITSQVSKEERSQFKTSILPRTLRRFQCFKAHFILDSPLPAQLEEFSPSIDYGDLSEEAKYEIWPKSMTLLPHSLISPPLLNNRFAARFGNLSVLYIDAKVASNLCQDPDSDFFVSGLPQSLSMLFTMALTAPCASKLSLPASLRIF